MRKEEIAVADVTHRQEVFDTKKVVKTLESLMDRVTESACTPETVNAACNCADKITDILRLHLDVQRLQIKTMRERP